MKYHVKRGATTYTLDTKHQTPGFAALTRKNSDGEKTIPFPLELLGQVVRAVVFASIKHKVAELLPAWIGTDDEA